MGTILALISLPVCSVCPGFFFIRRFRWSPMEKLCGSIGLSLILLYLWTWTFYCLAPAWQVRACDAIIIASLALGAVCWNDLRRLFQSFRVREAVIGYSFLLIWTLLILSMIRNYSGAGWAGDWLEHFQRTLFFLRHFPVQTPIVGGYQFPARPPMMNVLAAFFMAPAQDTFVLFQVIFTFLNLLVYLPCCMIMPALVRRRRTRFLPLAALFACSPLLMESATYTWTKSLTAFFVVLAFALYLRAWRKNDSGRMVAAFVAMSAGLLVHYSAGPYTVFLALHYLVWVFWKREHRWHELALIAGSSALLLATWFGWSIKTFGLHSTIVSNSSVTPTQAYSGSNVDKIARNVYFTVVPVVLRSLPNITTFYDQPNRAGQIRDIAFLSYQANVLLGVGLTAGLLVLWLLFRSPRSSRRSTTERQAEKKKGLRRATAHPAQTAVTSVRRPIAERAFWLTMISFCLIVGVAVVGEADRNGVGQATLLSLELLGLSLLAAALPVRKIAAVLLLIGCVLDFSFGVFLQARVENLENTTNKTVFPGPTLIDGQYGISSGPDSLSRTAWQNWLNKHEYSLSQQWLHEADGSSSDPAVQAAFANLQRQMSALSQDDDRYWQHWFQHHGGSITFFGDYAAGPSFAGLDIQSVLLLLIFFGMLWKLWQVSAERPKVPPLGATTGRRHVPRERRDRIARELTH